MLERAAQLDQALFEFVYNSETTGDGAEMFKLGQACPSLNINACMDAQPRPHWFQHIPHSVGVWGRRIRCGRSKCDTKGRVCYVQKLNTAGQVLEIVFDRYYYF